MWSPPETGGTTPYDCTWAEGRIYGRGVIDDKGPAAAALYALKAVRDSGAPLHRRVRLLVGCNEEKGSSCIRHYVEAGGEIPVMGFTPDGMYPIINGEKGIAVVDFRRALAPSPGPSAAFPGDRSQCGA